jgi:hypothetical protein
VSRLFKCYAECRSAEPLPAEQTQTPLAMSQLPPLRQTLSESQPSQRSPEYPVNNLIFKNLSLMSKPNKFALTWLQSCFIFRKMLFLKVNLPRPFIISFASDECICYLLLTHSPLFLCLSLSLSLFVYFFFLSVCVSLFVYIFSFSLSESLFFCMFSFSLSVSLFFYIFSLSVYVSFYIFFFLSVSLSFYIFSFSVCVSLFLYFFSPSVYLSF